MRKKLTYGLFTFLILFLAGYLNDAWSFKFPNFTKIIEDLETKKNPKPGVKEVLFGRAVRITDGDTIVLLDSLDQQFKIRLHGIDCPERGQDFGKVATEFTAKQCQDKIIRVEVRSHDRYGRKVGVVFTDEIQNLNLALLQAGLAWHYTQYDRSVIFAEAESKAREEKIGLWVRKDAIAPWEFRKRK